MVKGLCFSFCFNAADDSFWQGECGGVINGCNCSDYY